jgi:acyl-CoA dehydrogenase
VTDEGLAPDPDLVSTVEGFFADKCGADVSGEVDRTGSMPAGLWEATEQLGLPLIGVNEEAGGSGGSLLDILTVLRSAGRHAVPLPLAETHLAGWLLAGTGTKVPSGPMTVAPGSREDTLRLLDGALTGVAHRIPWARAATRVVAVVPDPDGELHTVSFDPSDCRLRHGQDLAGQPLDTVETDRLPVESTPAPEGPAALQWRGALLRVAQMAGALEAVSELTLRYVGVREQFGRPIGAFQAVQQHTVTIAQAAEITTLNLWRAARACTERTAEFEISAAKLLADESARIAVRCAHQAHGAIGMTREYPLHLFTRRLNAWRQEFGTERELAVALGAATGAAASFARVLSDHDNGVGVLWPTT